MQDKLVIHVQKEQTGLPPHKIVSLILDFALERIEIVEKS